MGWCEWARRAHHSAVQHIARCRAFPGRLPLPRRAVPAGEDDGEGANEPEHDAGRLEGDGAQGEGPLHGIVGHVGPREQGADLAPATGTGRERQARPTRQPRRTHPLAVALAHEEHGEGGGGGQAWRGHARVRADHEASSTRETSERAQPPDAPATVKTGSTKQQTR